jgi:hypothetical protein
MDHGSPSWRYVEGVSGGKSRFHRDIATKHHFAQSRPVKANIRQHAAQAHRRKGIDAASRWPSEQTA